MQDDISSSFLSGQDILYTEELIPFDVPSDEMLASLEELSKEIETITAQLTSFPNDLYEAEKVSLFGPDHTFPTIEDLSVPADFDLKEAIAVTDKHYDDFEKIAIDLIEQPEKFEVDESFEGASILFELSGNKVVEPTETRKAYFQHLELIKSIQLSAINEQNAHSIISKIAYSTTNMLNKRNVSL